MHRPFRLIVFDFDGVLVDTTAAHARAYGDLWQTLSLDGPPYELIAGRKTLDVVSEFTRERSFSPEQIRECVQLKQQRARQYLLSEPIEFPDTAEAVSLLTAQSARLGIGTGASRETVTIVLRRLGYSSLFAPVVAAEDVRLGKPSPEVYLHAMDQARTLPADTLIVEDSSAGLAAALSSGAFAVTVRSAEHSDHPHFLGRFADLRTMLQPLGLVSE